MEYGDRMVFSEEQKEEVIFQFLDNMLGTAKPRSMALNYQELGIPCMDLTPTATVFSEQEAWKVIQQLPSEKAPGPDGFTGLFYKIAWPMIKGSIMRAFNALDVMDRRDFNLVNEAYIVLLPKTKEAKSASFKASVNSMPKPFPCASDRTYPNWSHPTKVPLLREGKFMIILDLCSGRRSYYMLETNPNY